MDDLVKPIRELKTEAQARRAELDQTRKRLERKIRESPYEDQEDLISELEEVSIAQGDETVIYTAAYANAIVDVVDDFKMYDPDAAEAPLTEQVHAHVATHGDNIYYTGLNAVEFMEGRDQAIDIASESGWNWVARVGIEEPVIQVIRAKDIGMTWPTDGFILDPENVETIAVFDWSEEFGELVESLED